MKSSMTTKVPKPANQGGHSGVNVQPANIQKKATGKPGAVTMNFSKQPSGTRGSNKGAK
jgi:hypothetical protein